MHSLPPSSRRQLAIQLEKVECFHNPSEPLEQYALDAEAAADLLWMIKTENQDLPSARVLDLGSGTGTLGIGAALIGAPFAVGVDIDSKALKQARRSADELGVGSETNWIRAHVPQVAIRADVVIQNPPFGVKRKGSDRSFLEAALRLGKQVYSIHLASDTGRVFLQRFIEQHEGILSAIIPITVRIRHTMPKHTERLHGVRAEVYKIKVKTNERSPSSQD